MCSLLAISMVVVADEEGMRGRLPWPVSLAMGLVRFRSIEAQNPFNPQLYNRLQPNAAIFPSPVSTSSVTAVVVVVPAVVLAVPAAVLIAPAVPATVLVVPLVG